MSQQLTSIIAHPEEKRERIRKSVIEGLQESFPIKSRSKTLEVADLHYQERDFSPTEQKEAILRGDTLYENVKGTILMRDADGNVIDKVPNFTLARIPWLTDRHTLVVGGNEYSVSNQVRPKAGVYTRKRANGMLESNFNTRTGSNFNIIMDPVKGTPQLEYASAKIPLYPILRAGGLAHGDIAQAWGDRLAEQNRKELGHKHDKAVAALYKKMVPDYHRKADASTDEMAAEIYARYKAQDMDAYVNEKTIGKGHTHVTPRTLLDASKKLIDIYRKSAEPDDRDNLDFKAIYGVDDFFKERIKLDARDIGRKAVLKMEATPELRRALPAGPFTGGILKFINSSQLVTAPTQTNPMDLLDSAVRVTAMGEGGIGSDRAIPMEARQTHPTQLGALDPFRTPDTFRAGVDVRAALGVSKDRDNNIFVPLVDVKTGKKVSVRAGTLQEAVVAFPNQDLRGTVDALEKGVIRKVHASRVQYQMPHVSYAYSPTTNLIPFIESLQGNRSVMGSKMQTQALSLVEREAPYVQVMGPNGRPMEEEMAWQTNARSPVAGKVVKIDHEHIYIKPEGQTKHAEGEKTAAKKEELVKVPYVTNFPLAAKTHLTQIPVVKEGDAVSPSKQLTESNFTRDGRLALGKNLTVAYMPYYGANSNDAIVVSEGASKKLTSERMYKVVVPRDTEYLLNTDQHKAYYGHRYTRDQYNQLTGDGLVKPGAIVRPGDPLIAGLRKSTPSPDDILLGKLHKSLVKPYREQTEVWDHDHEGEVVDVVKTPKRIAITIKTKEPLTVGDKLAARYGNKGVVAEVVPDAEMIKDESGKPVDVILTSAGVVSRANPAQIIETAVGKVVEKTGKPIVVENLTGRDNVAWAKDLLKKHGIKDKETVYDPRAGKYIPKVFVGRQYILKLMKTTESNFSGRGTEGGYDVNQQPVKGGTGGSKAYGKMEFDALVAHNARNVLQEAAVLKSQKNDEHWRAIQLGYPTPPVKTPFAYDKLMHMLTGAGVKVNRDGSRLTAAPLTDADTLEMSSGEIKEPTMIKAKNFAPETGGLFDPAVTGGLSGTKWGHIKLVEPVVSPIFKEPVRRLLGMTEVELDKTIHEKGGKYIRDELKKIDLDKKEKALRESMKTKSAHSLDNEVKQLKYIQALRKQNLTPDAAYTITMVPVVPPVVRPVIPGRGNQEIMYGDINPLYRDLLYTNNQFKDIKKSGILPTEEKKLRPALQQAVGAVYGTDDPISAKSKSRDHKGFLTYIAGTTTPKEGFFHSKILKRRQDLAGRGTIVPDNTLKMDEIGVPEEMLWEMYGNFILKGLIANGYPALDAKEMLKRRDVAAKQILLKEIQERPVLFNRAPTLHRYSIVGAYPKIAPGRTIRISPFVESGTNADYDGDSTDSHLAFIIGGCYNRLHISGCPHNKENAVMKGNKEVYTVPEGVKVFGYSDKQQRVVLCDVTHFSVHHDLEMVEVTTSTGRKVKVSRDHSMFGMNPTTGALERFKAEEGLGWGIVRPRKLFCTETLDNIRLTNPEVMPEVPLTEDLGWLIGAWAGDGWVSKSPRECHDPTTLGLANVSPEIKAKFTDIVRAIRPEVAVREYKAPHEFKGHMCYSEKTHVNDRPFARFFSELTQRNSGAATKQLPSYFVQGPREFLLGLFAGLLDTDGTVSVVKAKAKNKPQYMVAFSTMSEALADHIATLALMLGINSNYCWYQKKGEGNRYCQVTFSTPDVAKIASEIPCAHARKRKLLDELSVMTFSADEGSITKHDRVPVPKGWARALQKYVGKTRTRLGGTPEECAAAKHAQNIYNTLLKVETEGRITRSMLYRLLDEHGRDLVGSLAPAGWLDLALNEAINWDFITTVTPIEGRHTAWDLTVPDGCTFMTANHLVVYDTMMLHVPASAKAVEEVKNLTMAKILYGDKNKSDLYAFPGHEAIMGIAHAAKEDHHGVAKTFKTKEEADKAYREGKITLGTRIKIEEH